MTIIREGVKEKLRTMGSPALDSGLRKRSKALDRHSEPCWGLQ